MMISYLCTAFLGFLVFGLGFNVSLHRLKNRKKGLEVLKDPHSPISRARVAHSNACQYCAMLAVLLLLTQGPLSGIFGIVAVVSRYLHAFGFLAFSKAAPNPFLFAGAIGTYTSGLALSALLLFQNFPN